MDAKPDGRLYSRITRKSVAIIKNIQYGREFYISEIAQEIHSKNIPEFFLRRFNRQMSPQRTRDYIRFLRVIGVFTEQNNLLILDFQHRRTDGEWAQTLSDYSLIYLAGVLRQTPQDLFSHLINTISSLYEIGQLPTLSGLPGILKVDLSGREEEFFKWAIYLYTDGETCQFDIRHFPILVQRLR